MNRRAELLAAPDRTEVDPEDERQARNTLRTCAALEDMYASDGWEWVTEALHSFENIATSALERSAKDMEAIIGYRKQLELVRWFLNLPEVTKADRDAASALLQEEEA